MSNIEQYIYDIYFSKELCKNCKVVKDFDRQCAGCVGFFLRVPNKEVTVNGLSFRHIGRASTTYWNVDKFLIYDTNSGRILYFQVRYGDPKIIALQFLEDPFRWEEVLKDTRDRLLPKKDKKKLVINVSGSMISVAEKPEDLDVIIRTVNGETVL